MFFGTVTKTFNETYQGGPFDGFVSKLDFQQIPSPTITCPPDITVVNDPGQCGAVVQYPEPTVSDECPLGFSVSCTPPSGSFFPVGSTTVTCTVTDPCGGFASCSFTVTVVDAEPPVITCPSDITVFHDLGRNGAFVNFPEPAVSDNCPGVTVVYTPESGSFFPPGTTTVTCTATDAAGNTSSCSFTITVIDNERPVITCPADITVFNDPGSRGAIVNYPPPTVSPGTTFVCSPESGSFFPPGTTRVTCTATDAAGNTSICSFNVRVILDPCRFFSGRCRRR